MMNETIAALLKNKDCRFTPSGPTIGEIAALAAGIRDAFQRIGARADAPVCLCVERKPHLLAALLASLAGAPPFILPHAFQPQVLKEVSEASPFRLILADTAIDPPAGATVLPIADCRPGHRPLTIVHPPEQPFLSLFTGGSTGKPKVWTKTPANLFGEAFHLANAFGIGPDDLILPTVGPQHIYGLLGSILLPFVASARVLDRTCVFPREILGALRKEGATVLLSVPAHYRALKAADELDRHALKLAFSSAAPLDPEDAAFFLNKTGLAIRELYGSTETGGMAYRAYGENHGSWEPFACLEWKIKDERLCVRSPFVSPDLPRDEAGFFMTADRVAAGEARGFRVLGRVDRIVKVAGKRVDLEEIREKLRRIPGVLDAHVAALPQKGSRQAEIAALVASSRPAREVRAAIRTLGDTYGRPRRIRVVKTLPLLPNGKIDRQRIEALLAAVHRPRAAE
ncbi:MAG: fatty acid--CoA ligase family protein [Deltaproteobacteria bacterium]|nr:fatty acid--CoA ligase family protein [Deltaproteobacteria bacterium]